MICPNCSNFYDDSYAFCPYCGAEKPAPKICPKCEILTDISYNFCPRCGGPLVSTKDYRKKWKVCPRCNHKINNVAKQCPYCNHRF